MNAKLFIILAERYFIYIINFFHINTHCNSFENGLLGLRRKSLMIYGIKLNFYL